MIEQKIITGDCLEVMGKLDEKSVDVVCTSPPYNIGLKYNKYKDDLEYLKYLEWMAKVGREIARILKDDGSFFLNIGSTNTNPFLSADVADSQRDIFVLQNHIVWVKAISIGDDPNNSFGHYKPINSNRYLNNLYEDVFHFTKDGNKNIDRLAIGLPYKWKCNMKVRKTGEIKLDLKCRGNAWFIPYETIQNKSERYHHPAPFPVLLPKRCIQLHGVTKNMIVVDPFLGIGNTLLACKELNVNGIGIDLDKDYCDISKKRLSKKYEKHMFDLE